MLPKVNRLCRTCMATSEGVQKNALFDNDKLTNLGEMLQELTAVEIVKDELPTTLCDSCVQNLKQAYNYKRQCGYVKSRLQELLKTTSTNKSQLKEVKVIDFDNTHKTFYSGNKKVIICNICGKKFDFYKFSVHNIEHNNNKTLLERFQENWKNEHVLLRKSSIPTEILNLVATRKRDCDELESANGQCNINGESIIYEVDFNQTLEIEKVPITVPKEAEYGKKTVVSTDDSMVISTNKPAVFQKIKKKSNGTDTFSKKITKLSCMYCGTTFSTLRKYKSHLCSSEEKKMVDFSSNYNQAESPVNCDLCNKVFPNNFMVSIHFLYHILLEEVVRNPEILQEWIFCSFCGEIFLTIEKLTEHKFKNHSRDFVRFLCEKCDITFDSDIDLILHEEQAHADYDLTDNFNCPLCNESFNEKSALLEHGANHLLKRISCRECKLEFCSHAGLNRHMKCHPRYKHVCKICGKCLISNTSLNSHMKGVHSENASFKCSICDKRFKTYYRLQVHQKIHSEHKKYMCSVCGYRTHKNGDLKMHMRIHTSEHPYKCKFTTCKRTFRTASHYAHHIRHHLDIRLYQCHYCSRRFRDSSTLKAHKMIHTGERPHKCVICQSTFRRRDHLKIHMKKHTK